MMTHQTKWLLAIAGVACVGGTGAWLHVSASDARQVDTLQESRSSPMVGHVPEEAPGLMPGERAPGCAFEAGTQLAYNLRTEARAELDLSGLGANVPSQANSEVKATTQARLEMRAIASDSDWGSVMLARFADIEVNTIAEDAKLQSPFLLRIAPDCSIDGFAHQKGADAGYARVQQALVHELSWMWPAEDEGRFESGNTHGTFVASVSKSGNVDEVAFTQTLGSFEPWTRGPSSVERIRANHQRVVPGKAPWFESLVASAAYGGARSEVEHSTQAVYLDNRANSLKEVSTDEADYVWADLLPHEIPLNERQPPTEAELLALAEARKLTVDQAVEQYVARVGREDVGIQDTWPPLRTFLEARPDAVDEVIERMKRAELPAEATMGVYIAIGNTRTPQALRALEGVMRDTSAPVIERSRAVLALIDRPDVGTELASYLGQQSRGLVSGETPGDRVMARQSLLALGAMSGRKAYDVDIKQAAMGQITTLIEETRDESAAYQRPVFGALANVGDPASLGLVAHIPTHPDPDVREAAAIVFRRMPPRESADFAARWLAQETDANVKRALWHTIELQTFDAREMTSPAVLEFALRDLREKPGFITRKALIRTLARALDEMPEDKLGIEEVFVELMPFEFEQASGFHEMMHDHIDPARRDAIYDEVAQGFESAPGASDAPSREPTLPGDDGTTFGGMPSPTAPSLRGDSGQ